MSKAGKARGTTFFTYYMHLEHQSTFKVSQSLAFIFIAFVGRRNNFILISHVKVMIAQINSYKIQIKDFISYFQNHEHEFKKGIAREIK